MNTRRKLRRQAGMTLIEVLAAILIFSFGLLGLVGLQARAVKFSVSAEDSNRAALLANEISSAILTQGKGAASAPSSTVSAWQTKVATPANGGLPNGVGTVTQSGNTATILITWQATGSVTGAPNSIDNYSTQVVVSP